MSFPAYSCFKDSGVEWLGAVPSHWNPTRLRFLAQLNPSKKEAASLDPESEVSFVPMEAIGERGELSPEQTRPISEVLTGYTYFREGDVSIAKITPCFENGKGAIMRDLLSGVGFGTTELIVVRARPDATTPEFLNWLFRSPLFRSRGEAAMYGAGGQKRVPDDFVRDFMSPGAPLTEQVTISAFLDRETAKIDALIEEQQRLISLLDEKRQAVISHAVTKGLDLDVPMKDSGIEWLGEVPAHWHLTRVARYFHAAKGREGQLLTKEYCAANAGDYPVYSGQTADGGVMGMLDRYEFDAGADGVLFSTTVGAKAMSVAHLTGRFSLSQNCMVIQPVSEDLSVRFFYYHFQPLFRYHRSSIPEHMQASFRMEDLYGFVIALAPKHEQEEIARYLDAELGSFEALTNEARAAIALLRERRSALISAAVTGKIDVCGLVAAQAEAA